MFEPDNARPREFHQQEEQLERANHFWLVAEIVKNDNERFEAKIACKATNIASPTTTTTDGKLKLISKDCSNFHHDDSQSVKPQNGSSPPCTTLADLVKAPPNTPKHLPLKKNDSTTAKKEAEAAKPAVDDMRPFPIQCFYRYSILITLVEILNINIQYSTPIRNVQY